MKKIGVISDTHLKSPDKKLSELIQGPFQDVDLIVHVGDLTEMAVLKAFVGKEVIAVCGNMDSPDVRRQLPKQRLIQVENFQIALIHGWGAPNGIEDRIQAAFPEVDCIIYGHTHTPTINWRGKILFFNPGAFAGGPFDPRKSVGLLKIDQSIKGEIIYL